MEKPKILIVDDSMINHEILSDIVSAKYDYEKAFNGEQAIEIITKQKDDLSAVLLDLVMPKMDGFQVLEYLNKNGLLENLPVLIISSETEPTQIEKAYDLGAHDFINRPFNDRVVMRRIEHAITIYSKKKSLQNLVVSQFFERQKSTNQMIEILANLVEFRNGESAAHIIHIKAFTSIILHELKQLAPQYRLSPEMITNIITASSLHDIGKIYIPSEILNKPGKLNDEEFKIMKTHSAIGADILEQSEGFKNSKLIQTARDIARWHHERFDGRGYPDGLKGEEIPIGAQVVALADVYDALISERCYKPAYSHEKSINMILNGECGTFNPIIMDSLKTIAPKLKDGFNDEYLEKIQNEELTKSIANILSNL